MELDKESRRVNRVVGLILMEIFMLNSFLGHVCCFIFLKVNLIFIFSLLY